MNQATLSPIVQAALEALRKLEKKIELKTQVRTEAIRERAKLTPKRKRQEPPPIERLVPTSDRWVYEALVLPISLVTCKHCGSTTEVCGGKLLLARRDKRTGALWESTHGALGALPELPRRRRVHETTSEACARCFSGMKNLAGVECLLPFTPPPVPVYDTPSAYEAAQRIAKMRAASVKRPEPTTIDTHRHENYQLITHEQPELSLEDL